MQDRNLHASYPVPAYGSFGANKSGCKPDVGTRPSQWEKPWVQEGARPSEAADGAGACRALYSMEKRWTAAKQNI